MPDPHWENLKEIFHAAVALRPHERPSFLEGACGGNNSLRQAVESLLKSHDETGNFVDAPAYQAAAEMLVEGVERKAGQTVGHYRIVSLLGEGGMGKVYLADDMKLHRKVSLKFLSSSFTEDRQRLPRFEQEARAASALNHPNILTIYEIGDTDRHPFIATEFIEGQTLRERLQSALDIDEALNIAIQVASALVAAHRVKIVHRDIKPENIMIRGEDGLVKVLDFGLAKVIQPKQDGDVADSAVATLIAETGPGVVMGTVAYMSPEQARGDKIDERTDIWSLGILLYEMITGSSPFVAGTSNEIISAILGKTRVPPLARYAPEVPSRLEEIVEKALTKDRDERYQTSKDLLIDLKRLKRSREIEAGIDSGASPKPNQLAKVESVGSDALSLSTSAVNVGPPTLESTQSTSSAEYIVNQVKRHKLGAVVALALFVIFVMGFYFIAFKHRSTLTEKDTILLADFVNTTGDATFDGSTLKQALAVQLRQTPFLNLYPEESVRETLRYMGHQEDEHITAQVGREICRRRGLKALLVGTIASLGRNYAITLEAVNGQTGETIASQQIEAEGKEQVLKSLGQAALGLRKELGESLGSLQKYDAPIEQATTSSLEALNVYSKGLGQIYSGNYQDALPLFNKAVELDPNFAEAYVWLAWTYANFGDFAKTASFAEKAYALRDRVTELEKLHIDEIYHLYTTGDFEKQKEADELSVRLYPNDWLAHGSLSLGYWSTGQLEKAVAEAREAIRLNPNEVHLYWNLSVALIRLNRFDEAREVIGQGQAQKLDLPDYRYNLYAIAFVQHDDTAMQQQLELMRKQDGEDSAIRTEAVTALFEGRWRKAQTLFNQATVSPAALNKTRDSVSLPMEALLAKSLFGFCPSTADSNALALTSLSSPRLIMFLPIQTDGSFCGDISDKQKLADEQAKRFPKSIYMNVFSQPIIGAITALSRNQPDQAIGYLTAVAPYEGGDAGFWPSYLRGQAFMRLHRSSEAAAEFQRILDHRGWDAFSPMYPLAHLGLARTLSLAGDVAASRKSYQDFFALWKDADPDLPILLKAKKEYEQLR